MNPTTSEYSSAYAMVKYIDTYGPIGLRRLRKAKRDGWKDLGSIQTGLIRKTHVLAQIVPMGGLS